MRSAGTPRGGRAPLRGPMDTCGNARGGQRPSVVFLGVVDRVFGNFDGHILGCQYGLAGKTRLRLQPPGAIEQVFFLLFGLIERRETIAHDDVAGRAGTAHLAGVRDVDAVLQQGLADRGPHGGGDLGACGAILGMGQDFDNGHGVFWILEGLDVLARKCLPNATVHALRRKGFRTLGQGLGCVFQRGGVVGLCNLVAQGAHERIDAVALDLR